MFPQFSQELSCCEVPYISRTGRPIGLEMLCPPSDSLEPYLGGIPESARRNSGEVGIMDGKILNCVLSLGSCFDKTHVESCSRPVGFIKSIITYGSEAGHTGCGEQMMTASWICFLGMDSLVKHSNVGVTAVCSFCLILFIVVCVTMICFRVWKVIK